MKKFVVLTDSTCDLPEELAKQYDIDIMCFKIALDGEGYTERVDFSAEQFCEMLEKAKGLPMTSQITQFEFYDRFEEYDRQGVEEVLYISINAGGSGTNAAAHAAAEQYAQEHPESRMKVYIVDSHTYSMAEGAGVIDAKKMLADGKTMEEVVDYLNDKYARMEILLTAYTLKVIRKSGRISAAAAIAGGFAGNSSYLYAQRRRESGGQESARRQSRSGRHGWNAGEPHCAGYAVLHRRIRPQV